MIGFAPTAYVRTRDGLEQPERYAGLVVRREVDLGRETVEVLQRLRGHVIEVDDVSDGMYDREEERGTRDHFVERYVRVERYVLLYGEVLQLGQQVPGHGQQQQAVAERQRGGRTSGQRYAHAHDVPEVRVLGQKRIICEQWPTETRIIVCCSDELFFLR